MSPARKDTPGLIDLLGTTHEKRPPKPLSRPWQLAPRLLFLSFLVGAAAAGGAYALGERSLSRALLSLALILLNLALLAMVHRWNLRHGRHR